MRIALFGGSFNPPHLAHVVMAGLALNQREVDHVLVVPCWQHAFSKDLAPYEHRLKMCRIAFNDLRKKVEISDIEQRLGGTSRTLDTLLALQAERPGHDWRLLIGSDIPLERDKWYRFDEIERLAPPLIIGRDGVGEAHTLHLPNISSTEARACLAQGLPASHLIPPAVASYAIYHRLYHGPQPQ